MNSDIHIRVTVANIWGALWAGGEVDWIWGRDFGAFSGLARPI
jgi:hypothetical protein